MAILAEYHRPKTLEHALELLADRKSKRIPLAGGTDLVGALETRQRRDVDGVVDLAGLDLSFIQRLDSSLHVGSMTTLSELAEHPVCNDLAGGILPVTARFEGPPNLRNAATIGGLVALAEPDSELFAALLALNASVVTVDVDGMESHTQLDDFAGSSPRPSHGRTLITKIRLPLCHAAAGHARIARTPMDRCIVAAVVVVAGEGESSRQKSASTDDNIDSARSALCGLGPRPQLADRPLVPRGDFKGSAEYRLAMAEVVGKRALAAAMGAHQLSGNGSDFRC